MRSVTGGPRASAAGASAMAQLFQGDLAGAAAQFGSVAAGAEAAHDGFC